MVIRKILKEEFIKLRTLFPGNEEEWEKYKTQRLNQFNNKEIDLYVIEKENSFIGELTVNYLSHNLLAEAITNIRVYLEAFRISKYYQKKGFGQELLKYAINDLKEKGYTEFTIGVEEDNQIAKHIYNKLGFIEKIDKGYGNEFDPSEYTLYLRRETKIVYFVHGTTTDNAEKLCSGWKEAMLNELGKEQAKNLGNTIRNKEIKFDFVFTSDLKRAIESSEIAFPEYEKITDKRLRECNYGELDGKHKSLVKYEEHIENNFPNGESLKDVEERMRDFIKYIKEKYPNKRIGIIAHRAPQLALEVITKNLTWKEAIEKDWRKTGNWQPGWEYFI